MQIQFVGHAGLFIETKFGSILTDPWFNPAYFASWFPFPSNEELDLERIGHPTYLYVSHIHHDHFDPEFLRAHVAKDAQVILPDFPLPTLENAYRELGFTRFIRTKHGEMVDLDGLKIAVLASIAPTDGPLGDSGLIVDDGEVRIYDQNDSRPVDIDLIKKLGPYDAHFVQFSGAIWYPMVYQYPEKLMQTFGMKKRANELARALRYTEQVDAAYVVPSAGPPCFLDDDLYQFNDFDRTATNTFPDQTVFLEYMAEHGHDNGRLMIPGSAMTLARDGCTVTHPLPDEQVAAIFTDKRGYLAAYKQRAQPKIDAMKAALPHGQVDILAELKAWFEPLMAIGDITCVGINGRILLQLGQQDILLDFQNREVRASQGEEWEFRFKVAPELIEWLIVTHQVDWINTLFLSCRFAAERKGPYNEYVYNFFKCLSPERLEYAEGYYAEQSTDQQLFEVAGYQVQRRCPHLKADLTRFGQVDGNILTCTMHGWQFELDSGKCLTSADRKLYTHRIGSGEPAPPFIKPAAVKCKHCWYIPD
nr:MBL fold metallo-hydrolase [Ktedonobacterales bacterium]